MPIQVQHVATHLHRAFDSLIDMSDMVGRADHEYEHKFLSRALTAMALQDLTGCDPAEAAAGVIDAGADNGIDGVAVDLPQRRLWLVQTKWSDKGRAGLSQAAVALLRQGIEFLQDGYFNEFNDRFQKHASSVAEVTSLPGVKVIIVVALLGEAHLSEVVDRDLNQLVGRLNELEPLAERVVLGFSDFYRIVREGNSSSKADLTVTLEHWGYVDDPYRAFYGTVSVSAVAEWYAEYRDRLFDQNIRRSLGLTEVNHRLRTTLAKQPGHFWYFNNGITILCETLQKSSQGSSPSFGTFIMTGVNVVNGAQTVKAIHDAVAQDPDCTESGRVWVRLISLENCPSGFGGEVTTATNTQNRVEARDFVAIDERQRDLRTDFLLSLQKTYVIQRGEAEPPSDSGCTVVEAAYALACAHTDPSFAARANASDTVLWETGPNGTYDALFGQKPNAFRVWRCVQALRIVQGQLQAERDEREGRAARVAECADLLTTHIVLHHLDLKDVELPSRNWDSALERVPALASVVLDWLIHFIDERYGETSFVPPTFRDQAHCAELARLVTAALDSDVDAPELPSAYRPAAPQARGPRAVNAVTVLVNAGYIPDGTMLEFRAQGPTEARALEAWLGEDPQRSRATWVNNRAKPLLWAADGRRYSPSGLTKDMLRQAGHRTKAVQGTSRWFIAGQGSLVDIADHLRQEDG